MSTSLLAGYCKKPRKDLKKNAYERYQDLSE